MRRPFLALAMALAFAPTGSARGQTPAPERVTLDEALARALGRNPDVRTAAAEVRRAEGLVIQARAASLPTLLPQASYTFRNYSIDIFGVAIVNRNQFTESVPLTVPVIAPQAWASWAHSIDDSKVTAMSLEAVRRQVAIAVATTYITVLTQRRTVELSGVARDNAAAHADYTKQQLEAGNGNKLDATRATQQLHTAQAQLESSIEALLSAQEALGVLVAGDRPLDAATAPSFPLPAPQGDPTLRADIQAQELRQTAAHHLVRDDYIDYLPSLSASLAPIFTQPTYFGVPVGYLQFQLSLVIPLYDGGARYGLARQRQALLDEATSTLEAELRKLHSDVRFGYEALTRSTQRVQEARQAAELAHEALQIATLRYREGATTNIEVIDAQQQARNADLAAAVAEDDEQQVRLNLLAAAGGFP